MRKKLAGLTLALASALSVAILVTSSVERPEGTVKLSWSVAEAQSVPDVTLNDTVYWDAVVGSAGYQVRLLTASSGPFWPDNTNSNVVHENGTDTFFALSQALTGAAQAQYKFQVRAVQTGGTNPTSWSQLTVNYVGLSPPTNLRLTP